MGTENIDYGDGSDGTVTIASLAELTTVRDMFYAPLSIPTGTPLPAGIEMTQRPLESWEHHVLKTPSEGRGGVAYCGETIPSHGWHFLDADHAKGSVEQGDRLQPCPACWRAMPEIEK